MKDLVALCAAFFKIGLFTFGGGYAMLPMLQRELVEKRAWVTDAEMLDYFAIGQVTPGIIAVDTAIFVGLKRHKLPGAIFALLGITLPSMLIILTLASVLDRFAGNAYVQHAFAGIRVGVGALILGSVVKLVKSSVRSVAEIILFSAAFIMVAIFGFSPMWVVAGAILTGIALVKRGVRS